MTNPHWEILEAVAARLTGTPDGTGDLAPIPGLPTPQVRELPYALAPAIDAPPLCLVCPPDGKGEAVVKHAMGGVTVWAYPVVVLLVFATNRQVAAGLEARLALRHAVNRRLFSSQKLTDAASVFDAELDPQAAVRVQAALGSNYVVTGFEIRYKVPLARAETEG